MPGQETRAELRRTSTFIRTRGCKSKDYLTFFKLRPFASVSVLQEKWEILYKFRNTLPMLTASLMVATSASINVYCY